MRGKKPRLPVECYKDGVLIGIKSMQEWANELGLRYTAIARAKYNGWMLHKTYRFKDAGETDA